MHQTPVEVVPFVASGHVTISRNLPVSQDSFEIAGKCPGGSTDIHVFDVQGT